MLVKEYMLTNFISVKPNVTLKEAVKQMVKKGMNSMIVVDRKKRPIGLVSSQALIKEVIPAYLKDDPVYSQYGAESTFCKYAKKAQNRLVKDFMFKEIHLLKEDDTMIEAASYMIDGNRRTLPVVNDSGQLVGVITRTCLKNALYKAIFQNNSNNSKEFKNKDISCS